MTEENEVGEESPISFQVKYSNQPKYNLTLAPSTTIADLKQKLSSSEYSELPADRQRLIYSGRVLKDGDTLADHKLKDNHTIHLIKSAASNHPPQGASSQSASTSTGPSAAPAQGVPTNLAAGTGNSPLAGLTGARYAGFTQLPGAGMFGPDGGMGPLPDSDHMLQMLENPQFQSTMNEALQNPQVIDMMIQQNPMLRDMGPNVRQMMQSPEFRRMMTNPTLLRSMTQMQRNMGGAGGAGGEAAFPAPGVTNTTPQQNAESESQNADAANNPAAGQNPFNLFGMPGAPGGGAGAAGNPFAALFGGQPPANPAAGETDTTREGTTGTPGSNPPNPFAQLFGQPPPNANPDSQQAQNPQNPLANLQNNPFMRNPELLPQFLQAMGGQNPPSTEGAANANPLAAMFPGMMGQQGAGSPAPQDTRPPEERYEEQLRQLNDMGFYEFERNIEALRRSGGSVQGAVEYLLSNI